MITSITFSEDKSDYDLVLKGLVNYNNKYSGDNPKGRTHFYVLKNQTLVAGMSTAYRGGWAEVEAFDYTNEDALNFLMASVCDHYRAFVKGITYMTFDPNLIDLFTSYGYEVMGTIDDKPKGYTFHEMSNQTMTYQAANMDYDIVISDVAHESYEMCIRTGYEKLSNRLGIDHAKEDLMFVAKEGDQVIGGVMGYIRHDYLYVSILWVHDAYRGRRLGSRLMDKIEETARAGGIDKAWLGTASYQAKPFYERLGYQVAYTIEDCPIGHKNYTMTKKL